MNIVISTFFYLTLITLSGYSFAGYFLKNVSSNIRLVIYSTIGIVILNLPFYALYLVLRDVSLSANITITCISLSILAQLAKSKFAFNLNGVHFKRLILFILLISALAFPAYLITGWGKYWHTANEDIFDATQGGFHYHISSTKKAENYRKSAHDFRNQIIRGLTPTSDYKPHLSSASGVRYTKTFDSVQYSSVALAMHLIPHSNAIDAFLTVLLTNTIILAVGILLFCAEFLGLNTKTSSIAAATVVLNHFYLSTLANGHEGSTFFLAFAPMITILTLFAANNIISLSLYSLFFVLSMSFIIVCYPYPLPFFLPAIGLYLLEKKYGCISNAKLFIQNSELLKRRLYLVGIFIGALVATFLIYQLLSTQLPAIQDKATNQFRSWGSIKTYVGWFQYWGLWPSLLAYGSTYLQNLYASTIITYISAALAVILTLLSINMAIQNSKKSLFFCIFMLTSIPFLFFMRYVILDSYYFYKFLYITQFVILISLIYGLNTNFNLYSSRNKHILGFCLSTILFANIANNISFQYDIASRPYNVDFRQYASAMDLPKEILEKTFIDIPYSDYRALITSIYQKSKIDPIYMIEKSDYLLRLSNRGDIYNPLSEQIVWENNELKLVKTPQYNLIATASYWEPELDWLSPINQTPFRWLTSGNMNKLFLYNYRPKTHKKSMRFCVKPGPSLIDGIAKLDVRDSKDNLILALESDSIQCEWIPPEILNKIEYPLIFKSDSKGAPLNRIDNRHLNIQLFGVALQSRPSIDDLKSIFEPKDDVINYTAFNNDGIRIWHGQGWHLLENEKGNYFRWGASKLTFKLTPLLGSKSGKLKLKLSPGPFFNEPGFPVKIEDNNGTVYFDDVISSNHEIQISIELHEALKFTMTTPAASVPRRHLDQRELSVRIEQMTWEANERKA